MELFLRMETEQTSDGIGGTDLQLQPGEGLMAGLCSIRRHRQHQAGKTIHRTMGWLMTEAGENLIPGQLLERQLDGSLWEVIGGGQALPASSGLGIAWVQAERRRPE